ncbi:30S ribosomal protein S19e [archaeon]|nr:MAG: 30S ribosomal protein S19e [archaeon]
MVSVQDVDSAKFVGMLKEELKSQKLVEPTAWSRFVKSGVNKVRPPAQDDFWYIRSASLLRRLYIDNQVGVSKLRTYYGGRKKSGTHPRHFYKASGNTLRKILQQLEKSGLVQKNKEGRKLTSAGVKLLNKVAYQASK